MASYAGFAYRLTTTSTGTSMDLHLRGSDTATGEFKAATLVLKIDHPNYAASFALLTASAANKHEILVDSDPADPNVIESIVYLWS